GVADCKGLDLSELLTLKADHRPLKELVGATVLELPEFVGVDCDIWIPAARPDVLTVQNVGAVQAKLILQGANIPATAEAEEALHRRGIISVPDFVANAGGVICAAVEHRGGTEAQAFASIEEKLHQNTREVLELSRRENYTPRAAAQEIAEARLREAQSYRRG
ncbi:MAG: Glu/Leu/Phe/Val dehydrogenase, partial [Dehalococcoidia bacterium]